MSNESTQITLTGDALLARSLELTQAEITRLREIAVDRLNRCIVLGAELHKANRALERASRRKKRLRQANDRLREIAKLSRRGDTPGDKVMAIREIRALTLDYAAGRPLRYEGGAE